MTSSTSAYFTGTNEVVTLASVEPSQAWKDFFLDTLKANRSRGYVRSTAIYSNILLNEYPREKEMHAASKEVNEMIRFAPSSIKEASLKQLGRPLEINAINFPEHFKTGVYSREIIFAAIKIYPEIKDIMQGSPYLNNIRLAYGLKTQQKHSAMLLGQILTTIIAFFSISTYRRAFLMFLSWLLQNLLISPVESSLLMALEVVRILLR
jgi:hypothetical protein